MPGCLGIVGGVQTHDVQSAKSVFELVGTDSRDRRVVRAATSTSSDDRLRRAIGWGAGLLFVWYRASMVKLMWSLLVGGVGGRRGACRMSLGGNVGRP